MAYSDPIRTKAATMEGVATLIDGLYNYNEWTDWTPTLGGFSANPTSTSYRYRLDNGGCWVAVRQAVTGTSNATTFTISAPTVAATVTNGYWGAVCWQAYDNGAIITDVAAIIPSGSSTITISRQSGAAWTGSGGKMCSFVLFYEA